ncbi:hypothetical protein [Duganella levis]|uniref:DUF350 domain-containing protein n=1 Tax=Duganella levis TaxID=2692169 RepID=A0ABW9VZA1_9BURK|nr:hypothetical protein [Duganella levis]MYN26850.1 hypothetical protein [Duganella levis]
MEFESIRPIISGLLGGLLAIAFCIALARWVPRIFNGKNAETLIRQNRISIGIANFLLFLGLLVGICIYMSGFLLNDDWRGLALGAGGGSIAALAALPLVALVTGNRPKEAYVAFAISQKTPVPLLYGVLVLAVALFVTAATSLFMK